MYVISFLEPRGIPITIYRVRVVAIIVENALDVLLILVGSILVLEVLIDKSFVASNIRRNLLVKSRLVG